MCGERTLALLPSQSCGDGSQGQLEMGYMHQDVLIPSPGDIWMGLRLSENISNFMEGKSRLERLTRKVRS